MQPVKPAAPPRRPDPDEEEHPHPKPKRSLEGLIFRLTILGLLLLIVVAQFVQIYYLRNLPTSTATLSDANGPIAVEVVNRQLRVEVDNPSGELGTRPLVVEISPYGGPVKVEAVTPAH